MTNAIHAGDLAALSRALEEKPDLATSAVRHPETGDERSLLHVATDWPGNFPNVAETITLLAAGGTDVNRRFVGAHSETPLHWAASSNDVAAVRAAVEGKRRLLFLECVLRRSQGLGGVSVGARSGPELDS